MVAATSLPCAEEKKDLGIFKTDADGERNDQKLSHATGDSRQPETRSEN
jgi:hypothetical protein